LTRVFCLWTFVRSLPRHHQRGSDAGIPHVMRSRAVPVEIQQVHDELIVRLTNDLLE
jgi:hypothetical protein